MTPTNKTQTSSFRQRGYLIPGTQKITTVFGDDPAPDLNQYMLVWDHWITTSSTTVDYANQDGLSSAPVGEILPAAPAVTSSAV